MSTDHTTLYAYYDLVVSPLSYDFLGFIVTAEAYRRANDYDDMHMVFVPFEGGVGHINNEQFGFDHAMWRFDNIVTPICRMVPSCRGYTYCNSREQAEAINAPNSKNIFPEGYTITKPIARHHTGWTVIEANKGVNTQFLQASEEALMYARQWIKRHAGGKPCVAITLREARFSHMRNSDLKVWGEFAQRLAAGGFFPIILRDMDTALDLPPKEFDGIAMFPEGVFNLNLRMGMYEKSHISVFVTNGPAQACFYNRNVKFLYQITGDWLDQDPTPFNRIGVDFNETPALANKFQRWIWKEQNADTLMEYFTNLDEDINASIADGTYEDCLNPMVEYRKPLHELARRYGDWALNNYFTSSQELELAEACLGKEGRKILLSQIDGLQLTDLANEALHKHSPGDAIKFLKDLDEKVGLDNEQCVKLGVIIDADGDHKTAAKYYVRAINAGDDSPALYFRLAMALKNAGELQRSIDVFERMIENGAASKIITCELGELYSAVKPQSFMLEYYESWRARGITSPEIEAEYAKLARKI